jgi:hypothetical protein
MVIVGLGKAQLGEDLPDVLDDPLQRLDELSTSVTRLFSR